MTTSSLTTKQLRAGIIGGMGPAATIDFYQKVLHKTRTIAGARTDQDHILASIEMNPAIRDRQVAIMSGTDRDLVGQQMRESGQRIRAAGCDIAVCVCNTAHYFQDFMIEGCGPDVKFLSIIDLTSDRIAQVAEQRRRQRELEERHKPVLPSASGRRRLVHHSSDSGCDSDSDFSLPCSDTEGEGSDSESSFNGSCDSSCSSHTRCGCTSPSTGGELEPLPAIDEVQDASAVVGILAASGCIAGGLYQNALSSRGIKYAVPDEKTQATLLQSIYLAKAGRIDEGRAVFMTVLDTMVNGVGVNMFILGCTELPLLMPKSLEEPLEPEVEPANNVHTPLLSLDHVTFFDATDILAETVVVICKGMASVDDFPSRSAERPVAKTTTTASTDTVVEDTSTLEATTTTTMAAAAPAVAMAH